jgi:hypothetical protein
VTFQDLTPLFVDGATFQFICQQPKCYNGCQSFGRIIRGRKQLKELSDKQSLLQNEDFRSKSRHAKNFTAGI